MNRVGNIVNAGCYELNRTQKEFSVASQLNILLCGSMVSPLPYLGGDFLF